MHQTSNRRRGFTLSEMMVVLGVLVVVTALAQPALRGALGDSRLRNAAKQVRVELAKTRLKAMQTGVAQQFRYQAGANRFEIGPVTFGEEAEQASYVEQGESFSAEAPVSAQFAEETAEMPGAEVTEQNLPEGIAFETLYGEDGAPLVMDEEGWSSPIIFYPNGRTADAHVRLRGERDMVVDVNLRGLTGVATAGKLRREEALR